MALARLVYRNLLDPRDASDAAAKPLADAVNIPLAELPSHPHELPAKNRTVRVAAVSACAESAVDWVRANRRRAELERSFRFADASASVEVGRLWEPNAWLAEVLPHLTLGRALELACGTGRDAVFMSSLGWEVTGADVLPDALRRAREMARRCAAAIGPIRWIEADLERDDFVAKLSGLATDGAQPPPRFDLITSFHFLHRPLFARLVGLLNPGGSILWETFTTRHRERHAKPSRDAHLLKPGELRELLAGFEIRRHDEGWHDDAHTARVWAAKI